MKRFYAFLTALALAVTCLPMAALATGTAEHASPATYTKSGHGTAEWKEWTESNTLPTTAGYYYLTQDVTFDSSVGSSGGVTGPTYNTGADVVICLNGHNVTTGVKDGRLLTVSSGSLTICDCTAYTETVTIDGESVEVYAAGWLYGGDREPGVAQVSGGALILEDGVVAGNRSDNKSSGGIIAVAGGTFTMAGGRITGNTLVANAESGIVNGSGGDIHITGGSIGGAILDTDGIAGENSIGMGGTVFQVDGKTVVLGNSGRAVSLRNYSSSLVMSGGEITNNTATVVGSGVYVYKTENVQLSGNISISGNKNVAEAVTVPQNLYICVSTRNPAVAVENLGSAAQIGVTHASGGAAVTDTVTKDFSTNFISDNAELDVVLEDSKLYLKRYEAYVGGTGFAAVADAVAAAGTDTVTLRNDVETITLNGDLKLDLNGCDVGTVDGTGTLYGMDSRTNDYDCEDPEGYGVIGTVSATVSKTSFIGGRRYVAIAKEGEGTSFHRFYAAITHVALRPHLAGAGYIMEVSGDQMAVADMDSYGMSIILMDDNGIVTNSAGAQAVFETPAVEVNVTPGQFTRQQLLVDNILSTKEGADNAARAEYDICVQPVISFGGTEIELAMYTYTFAEIVAMTDAGLAGKTVSDALKANFKTFLETYKPADLGLDVDTMTAIAAQ